MKGFQKKELNPAWKGDDVKYVSLHGWIRNRKPKPKFCERCNIKKPHDLANISGNYKRDVNDFEWLCRKCHMIKDGRLYNVIYRNKYVKHKKTEFSDEKIKFFKEFAKKRKRDYHGRFMKINERKFDINMNVNS